MLGQGDYVIVGKPFDREWMVWGGGLDKWGPFGQEMRFPTHRDAEAYLRDARRDAERYTEAERYTKIDAVYSVYVARVVQPKVMWKGFVYHDGNKVAVDFSDDDLSPHQMRELGVL